MPSLDLESLAPWLNVAIFAAAAAAVWIAGTRLAVYADSIADRTGWSRAFLGLVLLAGVTELPEVATSLSAAAQGAGALAVNNLFGGVAMQTAILVVADATIRRGPLTFFAPSADLLLQGMVLVLLLSLALAATAAGSIVVVWGVGLWTAILFAAYLLAIWLMWRYQPAKHWQPVDIPDEAEPAMESKAPERRRDWSLARLAVAMSIAGAVVLAAGVVLVATSDALAAQSKLGDSFVGATLLASSTSLPELSTTIAAARVGAYSMAIANIFGSNSIMIALLFVTDVAYRKGPILDAVDRSAQFVAAIGIALTAVYVIGLVERRNRALWRLGYDSVIVLAIYLGSLVVLYGLRGG